MASRGQWLKVLIGIAVSGTLLGYLLWNADLRQVASRLADTHLGFLAATIILNFSTLWMRARRWHYLFPPEARPTHLFNAVMIGYTGNNLLPLRAGEVLRVYVASRRGQSFWITLATLVIERVLDGLAVGIMLAFVFFLLPVPRELQWAALLFLSADLAAMVVLAIVSVAPNGCRRLLENFVRGKWLRERLLKVLATVNDGLEGLRTPAHIFPIVAWSFLIWGILAASIWTAFLAARLDLPFGAAWAVIAFLGLGVSLPSSPGFVGIVQAAVVLALGLFAVPAEDALSFSIMLHAAQFFPVTLYGLVLLVVEQVSLSDATRIRGVPTTPSPS